MSVLTTFAPATVTVPWSEEIASVFPLTVGAELIPATFAEGNAARNDVIREDGRQLVLVLGLQEGLDRPRGKLGEGRVRRRKHGERARPLQRVREAGRLKRRGERLEGSGGDRRIDDVFLRRAIGRDRSSPTRDDDGDQHSEDHPPAAGLFVLHECLSSFRFRSCFDSSNRPLRPAGTQRAPAITGAPFHRRWIPFQKIAW
jgi:hypothetical protein